MVQEMVAEIIKSWGNCAVANPEAQTFRITSRVSSIASVEDI
jgi:hypothetical protein